MKAYHGILPVFDDPNLVSDGGLVALGALARKAGFHELVARSSTLSVPAVAAKAWTVVAGMASGADNIDGLDRLRSGGTQKVLAGIKAPSTIGTFLRSVTNGGHVEQFAKVNRLLLGNLTDSVPGLVSDDQVVFVDIDDTIKEVHGHQKGGAGFGYTKVRGLNAMMSTISTPRSAPVIAEFSLRKGSTSSGKGAARQIARALATTSKLLGANQRPSVRADSAFCTAANVHAATRAGAWYSLTVKAWPTVTKAIAEIPEEAWVPINYPNAVWDDESKQWVSEAEGSPRSRSPRSRPNPQASKSRPASWSAGSPANPTTNANPSFSPTTATTPSSPTAHSTQSKPTRCTGATPSSSKYSPSSRPAH